MRPRGEVFVSVEVSGFFWTLVDVPLLTLGIRCICPGLGFGGDGECPFSSSSLLVARSFFSMSIQLVVPSKTAVVFSIECLGVSVLWLGVVGVFVMLVLSCCIIIG